MRIGALAMLASLVAACSGGGAPAGEPAAPAVKAAAEPVRKLPRVADLPCFGCHDLATYEEGPFPHGAHEDVGHCSACHAGLGHHGVPINRGTCLECHDDSELVEVLGEAPAADAAPAEGAGAEGEEEDGAGE